jgi:hypothetical protein
MIFISKLVRLVFLETLIFVFSIYCCLLCIPHANAASVTLVWDPNAEPDISGYRLYYGKASGTFEFVIDVGNQTTYNFSDLEDAKAYYFVVTAYDISGRESDFSSELRYPDPFSTTISLSPGLNLISLPLEPLNASISSLTEQLSPCLVNVSSYVNDTYAWEFYDPTQLDQNTLGTLEPGKGYWVEMACPGEMTVVGNRTTNPIILIPGLNLVGYNSLTPFPISVALSSIADKCTMVSAYEDDEWKYYDPANETGSTLQVLTPGSGYWIEVREETALVLP